MPKRRASPAKTGQGVDSFGGPVFDPSANVLQLVDAESLRQDGLRQAESRHIREVRDLESRHIREISEMRADYENKLRNAETARIDAIRAVDVGAVNRAAEVAATQAGALAAQLIATAEASRVQVAAAASASVTSLAAALEPIQKDIRDLRDAQSRGQGGKEQVVETRDVRGDNRLNLGAVFGGLAVLISLAGFIVLLTR